MGVLKGTSQLLGVVVAAPLNTVGGITKTVGTGFSILTDDASQEARQRAVGKRSNNVLQGLYRGGKSLTKGIYGMCHVAYDERCTLTVSLHAAIREIPLASYRCVVRDMLISTCHAVFTFHFRRCLWSRAHSHALRTTTRRTRIHRGCDPWCGGSATETHHLHTGCCDTCDGWHCQHRARLRVAQICTADTHCTCHTDISR